MACGRPLIGITLRHELETERFYLARFYGEAVEDVSGGRWAVSVQWHPEMGWARDDLSRNLFGAFDAAAREDSASLAHAAGVR